MDKNQPCSAGRYTFHALSTEDESITDQRRRSGPWTGYWLLRTGVHYRQLSGLQGHEGQQMQGWPDTTANNTRQKEKYILHATITAALWVNWDVPGDGLMPFGILSRVGIATAVRHFPETWH